MKLTPFVIAAVAALTLSGCAAMRAPARVTPLESNKPYYVDMDATRRGVIIVPADQSLKFCAEPAPDVAMESIARIVAEIKLANPNIDAKTQVELQTIMFRGT